MSRCFLHGYGNCGGTVSGEHYFSESVLEAVGGNINVQIGGFPWQRMETIQSISMRSPVSNVLCETHNSALGILDSAAEAFLRAVDAAEKQPASLPFNTTVDGTLIERWLLKVLCGLAAEAGFNNGAVPARWNPVLCGEPWPDGLGLYVPTLSGPQVPATEFHLETLVNPGTTEVMAAKFRFAGVYFSLALERPDNPADWGMHRPRGLVFRNAQIEKRIEFAWPFQTDTAVLFTKR